MATSLGVYQNAILFRSPVASQGAEPRLQSFPTLLGPPSPGFPLGWSGQARRPKATF